MTCCDLRPVALGQKFQHVKIRRCDELHLVRPYIHVQVRIPSNFNCVRRNNNTPATYIIVLFRLTQYKYTTGTPL